MRRLPQLIPGLTALLIACALSGCSTGPLGGRELYRENEEGELVPLETEILVESYPNLKRGTSPERRIIRCNEGVVTVSMSGRYKKGEGRVPFEDYAKLWRRLIDERPERWGVQAIDRNGGYYHVVRLSRGRKVDRFSAQVRVNVIGVQTANIQEPIELLNAIVAVVAKYVETEDLVPEGAEEGAGEEEEEGEGAGTGTGTGTNEEPGGESGS